MTKLERRPQELSSTAEIEDLFISVLRLTAKRMPLEAALHSAYTAAANSLAAKQSRPQEEVNGEVK
jgi:hypothetical protein